MVARRILEKVSGDEGRNVGSVAGDEDDGKTAPNVDKELIGPGLGRLESDQVATQQSPHDPQRRREAEVFAALSAPGVEAERTVPLVDGHGDGRHVQRGEDGHPELGAERQQERQQRNLVLVRWSDQQRDAAEVIRHRKVDHLGARRRH